MTPISWHSDNPGTPTGLTARVLRLFRPAVEPLDSYTDRVRRQAAALELAEAPLAEGMLEHLLSRAGYEFLLYTQGQGDFSIQARLLRREFALEYTTVITGNLEEQAERDVRLGALEALLAEHGVDVEALRAGLDGISDPLPSVPPAAGAGQRARPGEAPRLPERFAMDTGGLPTPVELRQRESAELNAVRERMQNLELEMAAQRALSQNQTPSHEISEAITKQTGLLEHLLDKPKESRSACQGRAESSISPLGR